MSVTSYWLLLLSIAKGLSIPIPSISLFVFHADSVTLLHEEHRNDTSFSKIKASDWPTTLMQPMVLDDSAKYKKYIANI